MLHLTFYILRFIENLMNPTPSYVLLHWGYWDWEVKNRDFKWFAKLYHFSSTNLNQLNRYFKVTRDTMYYFCVHLQLLKVKLWTDTKKKQWTKFFSHRILWSMCFSCHIRHLMKCPNWCRTWNICFLLIFSWKMLQPNFAFWDIFMLLRCLNSKEIKLQSSIRVICIIFDLIFFSWKLKT